MSLSSYKSHQGRFVVQNTSINTILSPMEEFIHQVADNYFESVLLWPRTPPPHLWDERAWGWAPSVTSSSLRLRAWLHWAVTSDSLELLSAVRQPPSPFIVGKGPGPLLPLNSTTNWILPSVPLSPTRSLDSENEIWCYGNKKYVTPLPIIISFNNTELQDFIHDS